MLLRKSALALVASVLAIATLTSCSFATSRVYTPANGVNNRDGDVDVLGAVIVADSDGAGTFIASMSNNTDEPISFDGLQTPTGSTVVVADSDPVDIAPQGLLNLADEGGVGVAGDFVAGDFESLAVAFGDGSLIDVQVPVVTACGYWEGLDTADPPAVTTDDASPTSEETDEPTEGEEPDNEGAYSCEEPSSPAGLGGAGITGADDVGEGDEEGGE